MSLNKPQLIVDLGDLFDSTLTGDGSAADAKQAFVSTLATIIDDYVKSARVNYESGLVAGPYAVTGTINHTIS